MPNGMARLGCIVVAVLAALVSATGAGAADVTLPVAPAGLTARAVPGLVELAWSPGSDDVAVAGYLVHRNGQFVAWVPGATTWTDASVSPGVTYRYEVRTQDTARNNSVATAAPPVTAVARPSGIDLTPPTVPTGLQGGVAGGLPWLSWKASSDDVAVTGYLVHRNGQFLAWVSGRTDFTDAGAEPGRSYRYEVRAQDGARNNSGPSPALVLATEPLLPDPPLSGLDGPVVTAWGNDASADGSPARPYRSVTAAVRAVPNGTSVYVSTGVYREQLVLDAKAVRLRAVPGAAPVLSGADRVTAWTESGGRWWTQGPDFADQGWPGGLTASARSALVDIVVADGVQLRQVTSAAELTPATFWVDGTNRVWIARNPLGRVVEVATRRQGLLARNVTGFVVDGLTFRHYASGPGDLGALEIWGNGTVIRNVRALDNANAGIRLSGSGVLVEATRAERNGRIGATLHHTDGAVVRNSMFNGNNTEGYHVFGAAGGIKVAASRQVTISGNQVNGNTGHGIWFDLSSVGITIDRNEASNNSEGGILVEVGARAVVSGNTTNGNRNGIYIVESNDVQVLGNLSMANDSDILLLDGYRDGATCTDREAGAFHPPPLDDRYGCQWPLVKWDLDAVTIAGNVLVGGDPTQPGPRALLEVNHVADPARDIGGEDRRRSAEAMRVTVGANRFERRQYGDPRWVVAWSRWPSSMAAFDTLAAFQSATGQAIGSSYAGP